MGADFMCASLPRGVHKRRNAGEAPVVILPAMQQGGLAGGGQTSSTGTKSASKGLLDRCSWRIRLAFDLVARGGRFYNPRPENPRVRPHSLASGRGGRGRQARRKLHRHKKMEDSRFPLMAATPDCRYQGCLLTRSRSRSQTWIAAPVSDRSSSGFLQDVFDFQEVCPTNFTHSQALSSLRSAEQANRICQESAICWG